jgi:hypothetical protein
LNESSKSSPDLIRKFWRQIGIWTAILLFIAFLLGLFYAGFTAWLMGAYPTPHLVLWIMAWCFMSFPIQPIWTIGIIIIAYRRLKEKVERDIDE